MQTKVKFFLLQFKLQRLQDAQREAISLEDDMILSGMKCKEISQARIYLCEQKNYLKEKPKHKRIILKTIKSKPPIYQSLMIFK